MPGCGWLERSEVIRTETVSLHGYAYDADLRKVGDAHLDLQAEVVRHQEFRREPVLHLRGTGRLQVGDRHYTVVLPETSPSFLTDHRGDCQNYFEGGGQRAFLGDEGVTLNLLVSEDLGSAYGLIEWDPGTLQADYTGTGAAPDLPLL